MRVLLLLPVPPETAKVYNGYHQGVGCLSAVLKAAGHETCLWTGSRVDANDLARVVDEFEPDLAAASITSNQMPLATDLLATLGRHRPVPVIVGGVHATVAPADALRLPGVEAACIGEGETAIVAYVDRLAAGSDGRDAPGFGRLVDGRLTTVAGPPFVDLDALPHPDRTIFDYQAILDGNRVNVGAELMAGRGCPFPCAYCANPALNAAQRGRGRVLRTRSVENVLSEIAALRDTYAGIELVGFHDDIFGQDVAWLTEWAERYPGEVGLPYWCNGRVGVLEHRRVELLAASGCVRVHFGVETGDEDLRREVLHRPMTNDQIVETFAMVRRAGMKTCAFFMMGLPHEDAASIEKTVALARRLRPNWSVVSLFCPYPGTELYDLCARKGWLLQPPRASYYDPTSTIAHPWIDPDRLIEYYNTFIARVYDKQPRRRGPAR